MNTNQVLVSAALLETLWANRKKDMLDLIAPFVMYATAKLMSIPGGFTPLFRRLETIVPI